MLRDKIKNFDSETDVLNRIIDNKAITIKKISKKQKRNQEHSQQPTDLPIQEVRHIKEEVIDVDEFPEYETSEFSDYDNTKYVDEKSANEIFFTESINFEAAYGNETISSEEINDLAQLYDLIDFICTKCRKTSKNPDYFQKKTDLQCSNCQATIKFQCPHCKLLFRKFDSAARHAKLSCQIADLTRATPQIILSDEMRKCLSCGYSSNSLLEFRNHVRAEHPGDDFANVCNLCSRSYKNRDSMLKHMRFCGRAPHITCVFCGYKTKRREHLRVHMRHKHPDPESCHGGGYECPKCKKKYKYLLPMKSHLKFCGLKKTLTQSVVESIQVGNVETTVKDERETV